MMTVIDRNGTRYNIAAAKSVNWTPMGAQLLCTVHDDEEGEGEVLGAFVNPCSVVSEKERD